MARRSSRKKRGGRTPPRKRSAAKAPAAEPGAKPAVTQTAAQKRASTRAERDAARRERAVAARDLKGRAGARRSGDRPPAPWGGFPLTELTVLAGIVVAVWGLVKGGSQGRLMLGMGVALASLGGLELSVREHFAGWRSHTTLLAGSAAAASMLIVTVALEPPLVVPLAVGVLVFVTGFYAMRRVFQRRSGGLSFR